MQKKYTKGSLRHFAEIDNEEECKKLKDRYKTVRRDIANFMKEDAFIDDADYDSILINRIYILDKDKKLEDDTIICNTVTNFC